MSFEDDEYWDEQYSDRSGLASAVARDRYPEPSSPAPFPGARGGAGEDQGPPGRRPRQVVRTSTWDGEIQSGPDASGIDLDEPPADELAARRRRRSRSAAPPARPGATPRSTSSRDGFDNSRPDWLNDPEFVPTDVSGPNLAGPDSDVLDFNRPELGANFDNPEFLTPSARRGGSSPGPLETRPRRGGPESGPDYSDPDFVHGYGDGYDDAQYAADLAREAARYAEPGDRHDTGRVTFDDGSADGRSGQADGRGHAGARGYPNERTLRPDRAGEPRYLDDRSYPDDRIDRTAGPGERGRPRPGTPAPDRGQVRPIRADRGRISADGLDGSIQPGGRPAPRDERQLPPPMASGRARVPVRPISEPAPDDALDLYRPPRDGDNRRDEPRAPAAFAAPGQTGIRPDTGDSKPDNGTSDEQANGAVREPQSASPRVISKAAPPATPKVIRKADPPAIPRVIKVDPPTAPARVVPATPPGPVPADQRGLAANASPPGPARPAPDSAAPIGPATAPPPAAGPRPAPDLTVSTGRATAPPPAAAQRPAADFGAAAPQSPARPAVQRYPAPGDGQPAQPYPGPDDSQSAQPYPGPDDSQSTQPYTGPDDVAWAQALRRAPRPTAPEGQNHSPVRSAGEGFAPDTRRQPDVPTYFGPSADDAAGWPAWADDTPVAGTPRVAPAHRDPEPYSRRPATPPQASARTEPMPINGATPRQVDPPAPRPAGHRAPTAQQPAAAFHDLAAQPAVEARPVIGPDQQPQAVPAKHAVPAETPAWQPSAERYSAAATGSPAGNHQALAQSPVSGQPAGPGSQTGTPDNPIPIGKLANSGADTSERHYADADLGATWFIAKTPAVPASTQTGNDLGRTPDAARPNGSESGTDQARNGPTSDPADAHRADPSQAGPAQAGPAQAGSAQAGPAQAGPAQAGLWQAGHSQAGSPQADDERIGKIDRGPAHAGTALDAGLTPIARQAAPTSAVDEPPSVVIDLDITGLINGFTISSEPTDGVNGTTPGVADSPEAKASAQRELPVMPGSPDESEPIGRALKPLSAEDLDAIRWRLDGGTLREVVDDPDALRELGGRLDEPLAEEQDNVNRSGLLSLRAEVYRLLGELGLAAAASRLALAHAEAAGDVQSIVIAQAELAHVLRLRGDFAEADRLFEEAASSESPGVLRSVVHENAGRSCFDQGRQMEALDHFARAIRLGAPDDLDLVERISVCLEAVYIHVLRDGWGPYPRLRREILSPGRGPATDAAPTQNASHILA